MKWVIIATLFVGAVVGIILGTQGCDTKAAANTPKRFVVVYEQSTPYVQILHDAWTGGCWINVNPGYSSAGFEGVPKEVCAATGQGVTP
ncbi:MAG TPA: hypothetical protein VGK74_02470 [Symbiobacteriaceae bacterium]|jgi:hypothetical protein